MDDRPLFRYRPVLRAAQAAAPRRSRSWFQIRDSYGVDVAPGEDDALILAVAVCLDRIHHDEEEKHGEAAGFQIG